jgi:signal transduction histidine kinase
VTADAIIPILFNNTQYFRTSPLSALFFVAFTSYAILRYDLLDIGLVLADMMVGIMGIILAVLPFLMPTLVLKIFTSFVFFLFCFIGYYLIRANKEESRNREDAEKIIIRERALRKEAEQLAVNLQRLDKAKTQFMLSTQHHLRSPLTVIQGYLSLIEEGTYGKINKEVASRIHVSLGEAQKLIKVVNDLLDMAKYQMNVNKTECQSGDVVSILRDVLADLAATARRKNLSLEYAEQTMLPPVVVNAKGIQEAIYNIVDNAIKYTSQGGVTVRAKVAGKNVLISIADTGIGMEEVDRIGLFKRTFERGDQTKGINTTGKGIGLYLAGQMILNSGGNIWVMSKGRGFGTTFYIELPVANPALVANPVINAKNNPEIAMSVK